MSTNHFDIFCPESDTINIQQQVDYLESSYQKILSDFGIPNLSYKIAVVFYDDILLLKKDLGISPTNNWSMGGTLKDSIFLMSLNSKEIRKKYTFEASLKCLVHEFVHCISYNINPNIANNPNWLWEGVAAYESGQSVNLKQFDYFFKDKTPRLRNLNKAKNYTDNYILGYSIIEFIIDHWGFAHLISLIKTNGNIIQVLKTSKKDFERQWRLFVQNKYLTS